jgi:glycosyltransferase involved in cell wall biosynthesis
MILLSILIPTIPERKEQFEALKDFLDEQKTKKVEVLFSDFGKKEMSIGSKRNMLYNAAKGLYSVQIDDDDSVPEYFIKEILKAIETRPDCVGYKEHCTINNEVQDSIITISNKEWKTINKTHFRTPFFKTPILTELCQKVGVKDMRFSEDHDFAKRIFPLLKTEVFIPKIMYYYTANSLTKQQHKDRYGI